MYPLKRLYAVWQGVREKEKVFDRKERERVMDFWNENKDENNHRFTIRGNFWREREREQRL